MKCRIRDRLVVSLGAGVAWLAAAACAACDSGAGNGPYSPDASREGDGALGDSDAAIAHDAPGEAAMGDALAPTDSVAESEEPDAPEEQTSDCPIQQTTAVLAMSAKSQGFAGTDTQYFGLYGSACTTANDCVAPCEAAGGTAPLCTSGSACLPGFDGGSSCIPPRWLPNTRALPATTGHTSIRSA